MTDGAASDTEADSTEASGTATSGSAGELTRAEALLQRTADALAHSGARPLLRQMADGTVSREVYTTYLAIEQRFVRTAARLLGYCIWQEREWDLAMVHARSLAGLVGEQTDYFAARVTPPDTFPVGADALERVVDDAVRDGGYPAVVTCLCAAETLYSRWCGAAISSNQGNAPGLAGEWIRLHATREFGAQAAFLQSLVSRIDRADLSDEQLDGWFTRMLAAEDTFHDSALAEGASA